MGGIISGFLGGAGRGAAQAGQMLLSDKLIKEREEANFLRDSQLRTDLQASRQTFTKDLQTERIASDDARSAATIKSADDRSAATIASKEKEGGLNRKNLLEIQKLKNKGAASSNDTSNIKNLRFLMSKEGGSKSLRDALIASFPNATISHTDEEGNISVAVLSDEGGMESIGSYRVNDQGVPEFVKPGESTTKTIATKDDRKIVADMMNDEQDNNYAWTRVNPNSPEVKDRSNKMLKEGWTFEDGVAVPPEGKAGDDTMKEDGATPTPETPPAPTNAIKLPPEIKDDADKILEWQMKQPGANREKIIRSLQATPKFKNWTPSAGLSALSPVSDVNAFTDSAQKPGTVASQMPKTEAEIIPPTPEAIPAQEKSDTSTVLGGPKNTGYAELNAKDVKRMKTKVSDLEKELAIAKKVLVEKGDKGRTGRARKNKVKGIEDRIARTKRAIETLSE